MTRSAAATSSTSRPARWDPGLRCLAGIVGVSLLLGAGAAAAVTYKWTDANGRVVYSDQPPPAGTKSELIGPAPPPANPNAVKEMAQKDVDLQKRQQDRVKADTKAETEHKQSTQRRDLCLVAQGKLKDMRAGVPFYRYDEKGARVMLDGPGRDAELANLLDAEKKYCGTPSA